MSHFHDRLGAIGSNDQLHLSKPLWRNQEIISTLILCDGMKLKITTKITNVERQSEIENKLTL